MSSEIDKWARQNGFVVEADALRSKGIDSAESLWNHVALGSWDGIPFVAPYRLRELIAARAKHEGKKEKQPFFRRYGYEAVFCLALLVVVILILRASGHPWFAGIQKNIANDVVVATHRLPVGHVIRDGDLGKARMTLRDGMLTTGALSGLIVRREIQADMSIMADDLMSAQVAAIRDLPPGSLLTVKDVEIIWLAYDPEALTRIKDVAGMRSPTGFRKGSPILRRYKIGP